MLSEKQDVEINAENVTSGPPLSVEEKIDIIARVIFNIYDLLKSVTEWKDPDHPRNWDDEETHLS